MTNLSARLQPVAGGLEVQLGNLWTVSPRGCHCRALWPHPALVAGLAMWSPFLIKHRGDMTSMVHSIVSAREGTMLHHERCGQARNVSSQGRTGTQSIPATTPTGKHFWTEMEGSWPNIFIVWWNLNIFHGKRKQKHNNNNKKEQFSAQLYPVMVWEMPRTEFLLREFFQGLTEIEGGNHILLGTNQTIRLGPQERSGKPIHVWFKPGLD